MKFHSNPGFSSRRQALLATAGAAATLFRTPAFADDVSSNWHCDNDPLPVSEINSVFGVEGSLQPGGVLLFDLGRTDVPWTIMGISVDPDWGFDTEITFQPLCNDRAVVKWEMCLLDKEVNPVWDALRKERLWPAGSRLNALHNHFIDVSPEVKFLHGSAIGSPVAIAHALYRALKDNSRQPFESSPPQNTHLPNKLITDIIGGSSMVSSVVLTVDVERKEHFEENGVHLEPASQLESNFHFQKISTGAIVDAEFVLRPDEVDRVAEIMSANGFLISAVHNHELFIRPRLYYLHSIATGEPLHLARIIRSALEQTNSKLK
jgi:hypothetical protein